MLRRYRQRLAALMALRTHPCRIDHLGPHVAHAEQARRRWTLRLPARALDPRQHRLIILVAQQDCQGLTSCEAEPTRSQSHLLPLSRSLHLRAHLTLGPEDCAKEISAAGPLEVQSTSSGPRQQSPPQAAMDTAAQRSTLAALVPDFSISPCLLRRPSGDDAPEA
jgi:hypothetical protein